MEEKKIPLRLAMRVEGDWWIAYLAPDDTMEGAYQLGSMRLGAVADNPDLRNQFVKLMQEMITNRMGEAFSRTPVWDEPEPAPESERSGRA
jgi:hypothetical protein